MICPHCSVNVGPGNRFCTNCGQPLAASSPPKAPGGWQLVVVEGPRAGARYPLGARSRLGRDLDTDIVISDERASRHHALVQLQGDGYVLSDQNSRNGTYLNGARVSRPAWLKQGDIIQIGQTSLKVVAVPVRAHAQARPSISPEAPMPAARPPARSVPPPPTPSVPPAASRYAPASAEPVLGIVPGVDYRKGLFSSKSYNLILTSQRIVFARLTSDMLKCASRRAKEQAKAQGKGFFGQWGASMGAHKALAERYHQMTVEEILREHGDNFFVLNQHVRKVNVKRRSSVDDEAMHDEMTIHAADKMRFTLKGTNASEAKKILKQVLGSVVK